MQIVVGGGIFNRAAGLAEEIGADLWATGPDDLARAARGVSRSSSQPRRSDGGSWQGDSRRLIRSSLTQTKRRVLDPPMHRPVHRPGGVFDGGVVIAGTLRSIPRFVRIDGSGGRVNQTGSDRGQAVVGRRSPPTGLSFRRIHHQIIPSPMAIMTALRPAAGQMLETPHRW